MARLLLALAKSPCGGRFVKNADKKRRWGGQQPYRPRTAELEAPIARIEIRLSKGETMALFRIARSLLVFLTTASFFASGALVQTLTLSPDPLNLLPGASGNLTLTYSQAAPAGGLNVTVIVVPGVSISPLPAFLTIPEGSTAITIP